MKTNKVIWLAGTFLVIIGCFLPWEHEGDLLSYAKYGIQLLPNFINNGGVIFLVTAVVIGFLNLKPSKMINKPELWTLFFSIILLLLSLLYIASVVVRHQAAGSTVGAVTIGIGLIMVAIGSALFLIFAIFNKRLRRKG